MPSKFSLAFAKVKNKTLIYHHLVWSKLFKKKKKKKKKRGGFYWDLTSQLFKINSILVLLSEKEVATCVNQAIKDAY